MVIDEVNTVPFFTPLWAGIPCFMFIHQLAREIWWYESPIPLSVVGYLVEPFYLKLYRHIPTFTVSASTENDLRRLGFSGQVTIIPEGIETIADRRYPKSSKPTVVYVGRLAPSKRIGHIIQAFACLRKDLGSAGLWLIGNGPAGYVRRLHRLVEHVGLTEDIEFFGWLPPSEKHRRMAQAHVLALASVREGWGLVVIEANALGTPAVVYDVPGLRDAVRHEQTGLVVRPSPKDLAAGMRRLFEDRTLYAQMVIRAEAWSQQFSFDRTAIVINEGIAPMVKASA
jgi:glycosyltransferase involved in cell wall biosynthesis